MITKGIVENVYSSNSIEISIPALSGIDEGSNKYVASVCTLPNCSMNFKSGDIVFVDFEENNRSKPVILGSLSTGDEPSVDITVESLTISGDALITNASIGNVSKENLLSLNRH